MQAITSLKAKMWARLGQKGTAFGVAIPEIIDTKDNVYVITADLGRSSGMDRIIKNYPERFVNVGIAEQNMVGVAAVIAFENNVVFASTFATFITMRSYEQVRHNLGYQRANVKLLGGSGGFSIGMFGNTHYSYEDYAIMRVIPNLVVISPADAVSAYKAIYASLDYDGPIYIRLSDGINSPILYNDEFDFKIGKANVLVNDGDIVIIATGGMVNESIKAAKILKNNGISCSVIDMHTIKPLDKDILMNYAECKLLVTVEEHSVIGGLGSAVSEFFSSVGMHINQLTIGVNDIFAHPGEHAYGKECLGLNAEGISNKVMDYVKHR